MSVDDLGNDRVDFVWGNVPLQRNYSNEDERWLRLPFIANYPGDGEAEYYLKGHSNITVQSGYLDAGDSHVVALRQWNGYPYDNPNSGFNLTVDWWAPGIPAFQFPNLIGKNVDDAVKDLIECGVNPATLVGIEFDAPDAFKYSGYDPETNTYYDPINAPGADNPGVVIYRYYEPGTVIGSHWDGRPWLAEDSENAVLMMEQWVGDATAVDDFAPGDFSWWHSFVVIQTKDPLKNSYLWWN